MTAIVLWASFPCQVHAQGYTWTWGHAYGGSGDMEVVDVALDDDNGSSYVCGYTKGSGLIGGVLGAVLGNQDAYLSKLDPSGNQVWAFTPSGLGNSSATSIALDAAGNVYMCGWFEGTIDLHGNSLVGSGSVSSSGNKDWFIASYTPDGLLRWRARFGGGSDDNPVGVTIGGTKAYLFGTVKGAISTGFGSMSAALSNKNNLALVCYDLSGVGQWLVSGGSGEDEEPTSVTADNDRVYVSYRAGNTGCTWYGTTGSSIGNATSSFQWDPRITAFSATGGFGWNRALNENDGSNRGAASLAVGCGALYITGISHSPTVFPGLGNSTTGTHDFFYLSRINPLNGQFQWLTTGTTTGSNHSIGGTSVTLTKGGAVQVVGNFKDDLTIGGSTITSTNGKVQSYVATFRPGGTIARFERITSSQDTWGTTICADASGHFVVGGRFKSNISVSGVALSSASSVNGHVFRGELGIIGTADPSSWTPPSPMCSNASSFDLSSLLSPAASGSASAVSNSSNVSSPAGALGMVTGSYANFGTAGGYVTLDLGTTIPAGATISVLWRSAGGTATALITSGSSATPPSNSNGSITTTSTSPTYTDLQLSSAARYIRLTRPLTGSVAFDVDGVYYSYGNDLTGTWSGPGVTGSTFNPAGLSGSIPVTYTIGSSSCASSTTASMTVQAAPNAGVDGTLNVCSGSPAVSLYSALGGSPQAGGTWSGPSPVVAGMYDPATMAPGAYQYTVTPTGVCVGSGSSTATVSVTPTPNGGVFSGAGSVCPTPASGTLSISGFAGTIVRWWRSVDGGTNWSPIANTSNSQGWTNLTGPVQFRVELSQPGCGTGYSPVAMLTPEDTTAPVLTCPAVEPLATVYADGSCKIIVPDFTSLFSAIDNCSATPTMVQSPAAGTLLTFVENTTVTIKAVDGAGNSSAQCTATILALDTIRPVLICPSDITLFTSSAGCTAQHTIDPLNYADNCWGNGLAEHIYLKAGEPALFPLVAFDATGWTEVTSSSSIELDIDTYTVAYVHESGAEDILLCSYSIIVQDAQAPSIVCPANRTVPLLNGCEITVNHTEPTVTDNCNGCVAPSLPQYTYIGTYQGHTYFRSWNSTGWASARANANSIPNGHLVSLNSAAEEDWLNGIILSDLGWYAPFWIGLNDAAVEGTFTWTNGDPVGFTHWSNSQPDDIGGADYAYMNTGNAPGWDDAPGTTNFNWILEVDCLPLIQPVQTSGQASGALLPPGGHVMAWTVTDHSGNSSSCSYTITVVDTIRPTISCPANISMNVDAGSCGAVVNYVTPVGSDNCTGATTVRTAGPASGSTFPIGTTTVTHTVTDAAGLTASCSFTVTVVDNIPPVISCPPNISMNVDAGSCGAVVNYPTPVGSDNCTGATTVRTAGPASGSSFPIGTTTVTHTVTDAAGLTASCSFTVTVVDNLPPQLNSCPLDITIVASPGACTAIANWFEPTATDNCSASLSRVGPASGSSFPIGSTTPITYTATDGSNSSSCVFNVSVIPTAVDLAYGLTEVCQGSGIIMPTIASPSGGVFSDANQSGTINPSTGAFDPSLATPGLHTLDYVFTESCTSHVWFTINVIASPAATISYDGSPYCNSGSSATVTHTGTPGGTYSATAGLAIDPSTGNVDLSASLPGDHLVTYTIPATGACGLFQTTASITVSAAPSATISYAGPFCDNTGQQSPSITGTTGGIFSADPQLALDPSTGIITPGATTSSSTGTSFLVTYSLPAQGGCPAFSTSTNVTITQAPWAGTGGSLELCSDAAPAPLVVNGNPSLSGTWSDPANQPHTSTYDPATDAPGTTPLP
ncbi:MAG: HYR domain-containing protein [Flavobacteriales bacterium]|nr:HYR domain-containing protein [Flavobacteriales bacterium]